jgi:hypothetical protein
VPEFNNHVPLEALVKDLGWKVKESQEGERGSSSLDAKKRVPSLPLTQHPFNISVTSLLRIACQVALVKDLALNFPTFPVFSEREIYGTLSLEAYPINENSAQVALRE